MTTYLATHPRVLSLLDAAKESPQDDGPRLVLADFLEDHGDPDRAEFIRLQVARRPGDAAREEALLSRHGGAWLGPLWRWWLHPVGWHRGLLSAGLPRGVSAYDVADALPWADTLLLPVTGRASLARLPPLLAACRPNHLCLDLRLPLGPTRCWPRWGAGPCPRSADADARLAAAAGTGGRPP